jgi:hypothetical protein
MAEAVIRTGIDPLIEVGPTTIARHGLTIAIAVAEAGLVLRRPAASHPPDGERR